MAYRRYRRIARPEPRTINARFAGKCCQCGGAIAKGELCEYFPVGSIGNAAGKIAHYRGTWDGGEKTSLRSYQALREQMAVDAYAGSGLDMRMEDNMRDACGL